jgi:hypothetical protein
LLSGNPLRPQLQVRLDVMADAAGLTQRAVVVERKPSVTVERKGAGFAPRIERGDGVTVERKPFRGLGVAGAPRTLIRLGGR